VHAACHHSPTHPPQLADGDRPTVVKRKALSRVAVEVDEEELAAQPKDAWSRMYADPVYEAANNRRRLQRPQGRSLKVGGWGLAVGNVLCNCRAVCSTKQAVHAVRHMFCELS
jgi:hypothetical protein